MIWELLSEHVSGPAFAVQIEPGCSCCGEGQQHAVFIYRTGGPPFLVVSFIGAEAAESIARYMNIGYRAGIRSCKARVILERE